MTDDNKKEKEYVDILIAGCPLRVPAWFVNRSSKEYLDRQKIASKEADKMVAFFKEFAT